MKLPKQPDALRRRNHREGEVRATFTRINLRMYSHLHDELETRLAEAERVGYGFANPKLIAPNAPKFMSTEQVVKSGVRKSVSRAQNHLAHQIFVVCFGPGPPNRPRRCSLPLVALRYRLTVRR